jgi:hypothetical protein
VNRPATLVRMTALGVSLAYSLVLYTSGFQLDTWSKRIVGALPALAALALTLWDVWLWRQKGLQRLHGRPRLDGLWQVTLRPTAESHIPEGGNRGPIPAFMVVAQSFWSVHLRQLTTESKSDSRSWFWFRTNGADVDRLAFLYENDPLQEHQHRSQRHFGSCTVEPASLTPLEMSGVYFTDRYTKGDMVLTLVDRSRGHASFAAAQRHVDEAQL